MSPLELALVLFFLLFFSVFSYKKRLLDFEGVLIANAVGLAAITYAPNPLLCFAVVVVFFVLGEIASNYPRKKHGQRNIWNVVGNSLPALIILSLIVVLPEFALELQLGFFAAISAALADTLSSEVGYYSRKPPVMITTLKKATRGTDGAISLLGELGALAGAAAIALIYFMSSKDPFFASLILLAGMVGTNADSVAGALFETKGMLNNTHVNMIGSASGAIFALALALLL
jgi:uncharacterized protein (TIGR00297 family)